MEANETGGRMNLREVLAKHARSALWVGQAAGIHPALVARRVQGIGQLNVSQSRAIARALGEPDELIFAAAEESVTRPGAKDLRGTWLRKKASGGAHHGKSTQHGVGMGTAGNGSVSSHGADARCDSSADRAAVPA